MKIKLLNFSKSNQLLLLDVLDFLVDRGNMNIWSSISSKKFFQSLLDLLRTKDIPEVQMKLLGLIQKWGLNFEDKKNVLPNFYSVYNKLRNNNVQFPNDFESNYQIYVSNSSSNNNYKSNNYNNYDDRNDEYENDNDDKEDGETFYYMDSLKNKLKVPNFEHKYRRLVNFLVKMHENIQMANLLMDSRERSGLKDIINTLRDGNNTLIDTISGGRLKDEKLMEITLGTTEDINQTLNRDEDIKNGYKPKKFTSYFVLNNVIPIKGSSNNNYRSRARSTKPKKSIQRRDERYKNYDMDLNTYDRNKYKEKIGGGPKNADDIFDLFSASNPSNEPGYNNNPNNQPINNFFSSQTQIRGNNNNNNNQYQLRNNPMNNIFNNRSTMMSSNNGNNNNNFFNNNNNNNTFQGNNNMNNNNMNNNNFGRQFNQNNNQSRPVMTNFDILEQKLNNLNVEQSNNFNFTSQSTQFNQGGFNNNNNNNNMGNNNNNNNNNNLMSMLDQLGPSPQGNSNQLVPYIGSFNQNNNNQNNFMNNNNNQFNNFNNNSNNFNNNNNNQFGNFGNNNSNNNNFNNINNNNNNNNQFNFNNNNNNNNNQMNNNNFGDNNNRGTMFMSQNMSSNNNMQNNNNNQINFNNNLGMSQNMNNNNNNNFGMGQNNNQQMNLEEMEKQQKLKELDDLF